MFSVSGIFFGHANFIIIPLLSSLNVYSFFAWLKLGVLALFPIFLFILPANFFEHGIVLCPSKLLFNLKCSGCGMTRAVMHFHHFQFKTAIAFNPNVILIYPALVVAWVILVKRAALNLRK
ncbi:MAG: DUF2752 domain-containing protein [Saprospiraceae bacterium]|nr:DUF2752 domain-containing protein [Saprospiraceae bacterium]